MKLAAKLQSLHLFHQASQRTDQLLSKQGVALTPRQIVVLSALDHLEGASQTALVDNTGIDRSTMTAIVTRLAKQGLLRRKRSRTDGRAYNVRLTAAGHEALVRSRAAIVATDEAVFGGFDAEERARFLRALQRIVDSGRDGASDAQDTVGTRTSRRGRESNLSKIVQDAGESSSGGGRYGSDERSVRRSSRKTSAGGSRDTKSYRRSSRLARS
jgi:DNA-binding MarR family transcriptional regulator